MQLRQLSGLQIILFASFLAMTGCDSSASGPNRPPVADAGPDRTSRVNDRVVLDGSGSFDPDGDTISYRWEIVVAPAGAQAVLSDATSVQVEMVPDVAGVWMIRLVVSDGMLDSIPDVTRITVVSGKCGNGRLDEGEECDPGEPLANNCCDPATCKWVEEGMEDPQGVCMGQGECELEVCDGLGGCRSEYATAGTPCGDGSDTECDNPDTCDGAGNCLANNEPDGTSCTDDGQFCTGQETCQGGQCVSGGNPCTNPDDCDEQDDRCGSCGDGVVDTNAGEQCDPGAGDHCCDIATCTWVGDGQPDPQGLCAGAVGECQANVCDGSGGCRIDNLPADTPCGSQADTECDNPDTCDGAGNCVPNYEPAGAACGDQSDTECDNPDTCDGAGNCLPNYEAAGAPCGDQDVECHLDDACDGGGNCQDAGFVADGTPCTDDGQFCTGPETCQGGQCVSGGNPCTDPADCDEQTDSCGSCGDGVVNAALGEECDPGAGQGDHCCDVSTCKWVADGQPDPQGFCSGAVGDCQADVCDGTGGCRVENLAPGTSCGSQLDTDCDNPDTCDGAGNCQPNYEPNTTTCTDDGNVCTDDVCDGSGQCTHPNNTAPCDDGVACTDDACQGGVCVGTPNDANCDDGAFCNGAETCDAVAGCQPGTSPCDDGVACTDDSCDEGTDSCTNTPNDANCDDGAFCNGAETCDAVAGCQPGTPPCDDGVACTDDSCDEGSDSCTYTPNNANCTSPDVCFPACSPDSSGCVTPPTSVTLACESPVYLDVDNVADCTFTLTGGDNTGQEACISCSASVGVTTLTDVDFEDVLNPGNCDDPSNPGDDGRIDGWMLVRGNFCYSGGAGCPMSDATTPPTGRDCCDNLICPIDNGPLTGEIAFEADMDTCTNGSQQWRLQRTFDTTGLQNVTLCFDYADQGAGGNDDVVQIDVYDQTTYQPNVFCDTDGPRGGVDGAWFNQCVDLPAFADDNPAVTIVFFVHSNNNNDRIFLDNITLRGEPMSCPGSQETIFTEDFTGCDLAASGWSTSSGFPRCDANSQNPCYDDSDRVWANDAGSSGDFYRYLDASAFSQLRLCFYFGDRGANGGEWLNVSLDTGSGWFVMWSHEANFGDDTNCGEVCIDLSSVDAGVDHNGNLGIGFELLAGDREVVLDHITLTGLRDCTTADSVSLSTPQDPDDDGAYDFTATDNDAQLTAHLTCQWRPDSSLQDDTDVWYRPVGVWPTNLEPDYMCLNRNSLNLTNTGIPPTIDTDSGTISGVPAGEIIFFTMPQPAGPDLGVFVFDSINIATDVTVTGSNALVLLSCHDVNISGIIDACASGQTGGPGGLDGGPSESDGTGYDGGAGAAGPGQDGSPWWEAGGGGAGFAGVGGDGGDPAQNYSGGQGGAIYGSPQLSPLMGGSGGGGGGCWTGDGGGVGGGGGGAVHIAANDTITIMSPGGINVCGAGGRAPTRDGCAGGGGGSGGAILLEAIEITGNGTLAANGGGGGGGDEWSGGSSVTATDGEDGPFAFARASGGAGGGNGGAGGRGGGAGVADGEAGGNSTKAGGGGGAGGYVRLNTLSGSAGFTGTVSAGQSSQGQITPW